MQRAWFCQTVFVLLACLLLAGSVEAGGGGGWSLKGPEGGTVLKVDVLTNGDVLPSTRGGVYQSGRS